MKLNDLLIFGMILQADIFEDGHGTTKEDEVLMQKALMKYFDMTEDAPIEEKNAIDAKLERCAKELTETFRLKIQEFLDDK